MLCPQVQTELSWMCYMDSGWRNNRADKKEVVCLFAWRSINNLMVAFALVRNTCTHTGMIVGLVPIRLGEDLAPILLLVLFPPPVTTETTETPFTLKLVILWEGRVVARWQSWGREDVIQLLDTRAELVHFLYGAPLPCWEKEHLKLSCRLRHICLQIQ